MKITIIAFGDSLTVGYQSPKPATPTTIITPYTDTLGQRLKKILKERKDRLQITIINKGICGDLTSGMLLRFNRDVLKIKPEYTIILGGSNDIGWGIPPSEVFENLKNMYDETLTNKIGLLTCTVPSILGFDDLIPPRIELNRMIKQYSLKHRIPCADLFTVTSEPETTRLLEKYSNDGLHLNSHGYEKIGEEIFKTLRPIILRIYHLDEK